MRKTLVLLVIGVLILPLGLRAIPVKAAAEPDILITWKPLVYTPPGFEGRILPVANARIVASVTVVDNGRVADLSGQTIYWYLNDEFIEGTANKRTVEFRAPAEPNSRMDLRVEIPTYGNSGGILKTVEIPLLQPVVVIDAPFQKKMVSGESFQVHALPYFFNVSRLSYLKFSWSADGKSATNDDPTRLVVHIVPGTSSGYQTQLSLSALNPFGQDTFEGADDSTVLTFVQ